MAEEVYPTRPIRVVIPYPPGGGSDIVGRYILQKLIDETGWVITIENISGATGMIGTRKVSMSPNDGYTLLFGHIAPNAINPGDFLNPPVPADWNLVPIARVATAPLVLLSRKNTNIRTIDDFNKWIQNRDVVYGSDGIGSLAHLQMFSVLNGKAKTLTHIPYKGGAPALQGFISGDVPIIYSPLPVMLGFSGSGLFNIVKQENNSSLWWGLFGPAKIPPAIIKIWDKKLKDILEDPETIIWLSKYGYNMGYMNPVVFNKFVTEETRRWHNLSILIPKE